MPHLIPPQPDLPDGTLHVAIIMDGNGRWARARGLPRTAGHKKGAEAVRATVKASARLGVTHLTLFGFSSENWRRPADEVNALMGLLRIYLRNEVDELEREGVCVRVIGDRDRFSDDIRALIATAEARTRDNRRLVLTVALNYGGRAEIATAARRIAEAVAAGDMTAEQVSEATLADHLFTADLPDPDVLIRTSGEQRISNFLLWQIAYTELVFTDVAWPDFAEEDLADALRDFRGRERRFGAVSG
ncbi:isoprenyl transferase [Roseospira visakhapatnamensis]|uniref:Isoprenyl transferase n=1 Tax=Roseospira visakhapatnamensis TaxID=390880 RepID=A0A7W6W985_9PROT|nr:isoprenyl transferase [Roseospira visakhapatnamensis]MBB4265850.1 undecaprenyl diphosphate synthase [Roseospira visakhapatnamensis]